MIPEEVVSHPFIIKTVKGQPESNQLPRLLNQISVFLSLHLTHFKCVVEVNDLVNMAIPLTHLYETEILMRRGFLVFVVTLVVTIVLG